MPTRSTARVPIRCLVADPLGVQVSEPTTPTKPLQPAKLGSEYA